MLQMFAAKKLVAGILCAVATGLLAAQALYGLWQIKSVSGYFQRRGLSVEKAQQEAAVSLATSELGKSVAREAAPHV
jgi:hypothetical protein